MSVHTSMNILKTRELAMHISLINQENERTIRDIRHFKEVEKYGAQEAARMDEERRALREEILYDGKEKKEAVICDKHNKQGGS